MAAAMESGNAAYVSFQEKEQASLRHVDGLREAELIWTIMSLVRNTQQAEDEHPHLALRFKLIDELHKGRRRAQEEAVVELRDGVAEEVENILLPKLKRMNVDLMALKALYDRSFLVIKQYSFRLTLEQQHEYLRLFDERVCRPPSFK